MDTRKRMKDPWKLGKFDDFLGYDGMTGGVQVGPALLDGREYGQKCCEPLKPAARARMLADAALISAAHELRYELEQALEVIKGEYPKGQWAEYRVPQIEAALTKAKGE